LVLVGNSLDQVLEDELVLGLSEVLAGGPLPGAAVQGSSAPRSVGELARQVSGLRRPLGIEARYRRRGGRVVYRSGEVAFEGRARLNLRVLPTRR
jgi:hypothetical protein